MSMVGKQLHQAREAKGLTIQQVGEATKIRTDHIQAIEEGNFGDFPAPIYIRGFVRTYATLLKLDAAQTVAALDSELGRMEKFREPPPFPEYRHTLVDSLTLLLSKVNWKVGLKLFATVLVLVVGTGIYVAWRHYRNTDPLADLAPGVYQPQVASGDTLPLPAPRKQ
jgi:cytoskeletal protein RodZ